MYEVENGIVVYDDFNILKKLSFCSMAEYQTLYGEQKIVIILNHPLIIISDSISRFDESVLKKYDRKFSYLYSAKKYIHPNTFLSLKGEYKLSDKEFIIDLPYSLIIKKSQRKIKIRYSISLPISIDNLSNENRIFSKVINIDSDLTFYDYDKIKSLNDDVDVEELLEEYKRRRSLQFDFDSEETPNNIKQIVKEKPPKNEQPETKKVRHVKKYIRNKIQSPKGNLEPEKKQRSILSTTRNMTIVKYLKNLYNDYCQICGEAIEISPDNFLSEVHHIQPLGAHNGADVLENMIVLCPNHHAMFDRGAITIDIDKKIVLHCNPDNPLHNKTIQLKHDVGRAYIDYHNQNIFLVKIKPIVRKEDNDTQTQIESIPKNSVGQFVDYGNIVSLQDIDTKEFFDVRIEDKFNKDFMKPIEKVLLQKYLDEIVCFDGFKYAIIRINKL